MLLTEGYCKGGWVDGWDLRSHGMGVWQKLITVLDKFDTYKGGLSIKLIKSYIYI